MCAHERGGTQRTERGRELSVQLFKVKSCEHIHRCALGIPPAGRDRKATPKQSKLPWDGFSSPPSQSSCIHARPCGALRGVVKIGTHSSQSSCLPALMDVSLFQRDNEIEERQDFRLLRDRCGHELKIQTHLIPLCYRVYYT